jgi:hypothetical protein
MLCLFNGADSTVQIVFHRTRKYGVILNSELVNYVSESVAANTS